MAEVGNQLSSSNGLMGALRGYTITNQRMLLAQYYNEMGLVQTLVDTPVDDAFRGGLDFVCPEIDLEDMDAFQEAIEESNDLLTFTQALKWCRLFGGGGIIPNCGQNLEHPFSIERVTPKTPLEFYAVDRWELAFQNSGNYVDQMAVNTIDKPYNYYGHILHKSNVLRLQGREAPSILRGQYASWGVSVIEHLVRSLNMYSKNADVVYELLDEAKIDVYHIQNFNSSLATPGGSQTVANRIFLTAQLKNFQNALAVDKEDDFTQKQISFSGLGEILDQIRIGLASDCHMPLTKLFGVSPAGFDDGSSDIENYNNMVETEIRSKHRKPLKEMLLIRFRKCFGFTPTRFHFAFKPLRELNPKEQSEVATQKVNRIIAGLQNGLMTSEKAAEQANAEHIYKMPLDANQTMSLEELQKIKGGEKGPVVPGYGAGVSVVTP